MAFGTAWAALTNNILWISFLIAEAPTQNNVEDILDRSEVPSSSTSADGELYKQFASGSNAVEPENLPDLIFAQTI